MFGLKEIFLASSVLAIDPPKESVSIEVEATELREKYSELVCGEDDPSSNPSTQEAEPTLRPENEPLKIAPGPFSFEKLMEGIECNSQLTLDRAIHLTENELLEVLKCEKIKKVDFKIKTTSIELSIELEKGGKIKHEVLLSFSKDFQAYLLSRGIKVETLFEGPVEESFLKKNIFLISCFATFLMLYGPSIYGRLRKKDHNKSQINTLSENEVEKPNIRLDDIGGLKNIKADLKELIENIKKRKEILEMGGNIPKGVLFMGPTGTGKTLTARAIATETNMPFIAIAGSEISSKWIGETSKKIRELFENARALAKENGACLIFIDELDSVGHKRSSDNNPTTREHNAIVNQLLVAMDGFDSEEGIVVIGATNHSNVLDRALIRPGRFTRHLTFHLPDQEGRIEILKINTKNIELSEEVRLEAIASTLVGKSGAEIAQVVDEATLIAIKRGIKPLVLTQSDLSQALDRTILGIESDITLSTKETKRVAFHEAGHTVLALSNPSMTVERVTVVPRGQTLGVTITPPFEESHLYTQSELTAQIEIFLGGILSERLFLKEGSTTVADDIYQATELAKNMVREYGMVEGLEEMCDVRAYEVNGDKENSKAIEDAINGILLKSRDAAKKTLQANENLLRAIAEKLIEKRTLEHVELMELVRLHPVIEEEVMS